MSDSRGARHASFRRTQRMKGEMFPVDAGDKDDNKKIGRGGGVDPYAAAAAAAPRLEKRPNVAGFLAKAYQIFDNPAWSDVCGWGQDGESVVIRQQIEFAQRILPLFFNHSNLQSFVRQLNMYNFRKVVQDPNSGEFKHDLFRKGNEHLLHLIKRKQSSAAAAAEAAAAGLNRGKLDSDSREGGGGGEKYRIAKGEKVPEEARVAGGILEEADGVLDELVRLREWKEEMENTVVALKRDNETLQNENQMLKGQVAEHANQQLVLQNKMQKILFCMYDVYVTGLRGASAAGAVSTDVVNTDASGGDIEVERRRIGGAGATNSASGRAAGSALERALQQLAALGGESMSTRLNRLDMKHPWSGGAGTGASASGDGRARSPPQGSSSGGNGVVTGGGALTRTKSWSQSSYEWLRSLRDPDPLSSIGSPGDSSSGGGGGGGAGSAAPVSDADVSVSAVEDESPKRPTKRKRTAPSAADEVGGSAKAVDHHDSDAAAAAASTSGKSDMMSVPSFSPDAPLEAGVVHWEEGGSAEGQGATGGLFGEKGRGVAGTGGQNGPEVWGGGALKRTLSEGATQVVSELGEMGHQEGETLTKIDSLGYQLAALLDSNTLLNLDDDMPMIGERSGSLGFYPGTAGTSPTGGESCLSPVSYPTSPTADAAPTAAAVKTEPKGGVGAETQPALAVADFGAATGTTVGVSGDGQGVTAGTEENRVNGESPSKGSAGGGIDDGGSVWPYEMVSAMDAELGDSLSTGVVDVGGVGASEGPTAVGGQNEEVAEAVNGNGNAHTQQVL